MHIYTQILLKTFYNGKTDGTIIYMGINEKVKNSLPCGLNLIETDEGLALTDGTLFMSGDFTKLLPRLKTNNLNSEMLVKATRLKDAANPTLLDATAGMGEDSLILAAAGFKVDLYEYDPIIATLLSDTLSRSRKVPELSEIVARMTLHEENSIEAMRNIETPPDVILLDPMFPARSKSGLIKKKFQLLQKLEKPCDNEEALLEAALLAKPRKIVIKRPAKGPFLAGRKPDYSLDGKAVRYDCIILPR